MFRNSNLHLNTFCIDVHNDTLNKGDTNYRPISILLTKNRRNEKVYANSILKRRLEEILVSIL